MIEVIGVRFKKAGKIYYFDPDQIEVNKGNNVIVETVRGIEFGAVVVGPKMIDEAEIVSPLKKVLRIATEEDETINNENKVKEEEAFNVCLDKIQKHELDMKLIDVEYTFDNNKVIFYFTADGRVDFRELVKDLAAVFRTRIELRQIGVRDEAKMLNGIGPCGRSLCCATWLGEFDPVSIKMAKDQSLSLNPTKISGICGRLMCCLRYEHDTYKRIKSMLPKVGERVITPDGMGVVTDTNIILEQVKVKLVIGKNDHGDVLDEDYSVYKYERIQKSNRDRQRVNKPNEATGDANESKAVGNEKSADRRPKSDRPKSASNKPKRNDSNMKNRKKPDKANGDGGESGQKRERPQDGKKEQRPQGNRGDQKPNSDRVKRNKGGRYFNKDKSVGPENKAGQNTKQDAPKPKND